MDGEEGVNSDIIIFDVDVVVFVNGVSGFYVFFELFFSEEVEKDKEFEVENDSGFFVDSFGDFVVVIGFVVVFGVVFVRDWFGFGFGLFLC